MKSFTKVSVVLGSILFGTIHLFASEVPAMTDSVSKKETKALANPKMTDGEHAAKAKIEEEKEKRNFDAKMVKNKFSKEVKSDKKDLNGENKAEVKTIEREDAIKPAMTDSVVKKETKALANPKMTDGKHAAKAKIEEEKEKRNFDAKMVKDTFNNEVKSDEKDLNGENKAEIKTIEKEQAH